VLREVTVVQESLPARLALVRLLSGVQSAVNVTRRRLRKVHAADVARVRSLSRVDPPVALEAVGASKFAAAHVALVGFLAGVRVGYTNDKP
jgi:hypothetical protein